VAYPTVERKLNTDIPDITAPANSPPQIAVWVENGFAETYAWDVEDLDTGEMPYFRSDGPASTG
jgi:hypothetical protein